MKKMNIVATSYRYSALFQSLVFGSQEAQLLIVMDEYVSRTC